MYNLDPRMALSAINPTDIFLTAKFFACLFSTCAKIETTGKKNARKEILQPVNVVRRQGLHGRSVAVVRTGLGTFKKNKEWHEIPFESLCSTSGPQLINS